MMATELIAFLVIFLAMFIRILSGFGSALLSVPLLSLLYGAKYAIPFIMVFECLIDLLILANGGMGTKEEVDRALPLLVAGLIGIPLGTQVLIVSSEELLRIVMGVALIVFSLVSLLSVDLRIKREKERLHPGRNPGRISLRQHWNARAAHGIVPQQSGICQTGFSESDCHFSHHH